MIPRFDEDKSDRTFAHHKPIAEARRVLIAAIMVDAVHENVDTVVFIGGHVKREKAWCSNVNYVYINPECSTEDIYNNNCIEEDAKVNTHLIKKRLQEVT